MPVLKDLLENSKDGEWGKSEPFDESVEMSVIRGTDFESARVGSVEGVPERFIAKRHHDRKVLKPWDILLETAGGSKNRPTGRTLLVKPALLRTLGKPATCASFARFLRIDNSKAYPPYVFWLLQHLYSNGILFKYHTQHTGVARFQYTSFAENEELILPSLDLQVHIASILSTYDDLIVNNTRRIEILEEMARRLYEEWFVHFRFPGHEEVSFKESELGEIPEGWEVVQLGEIVHEVKGTISPSRIDPDTPYVGLEHIPRRSITLKDWSTADTVESSKLPFRKGDILFGKIRPYFHKVSVAPVDGICSSDTILLRAKQEEHFGLALCCASSDEFVDHATQTSNGTKMPRANWKVLSQYPLLLPNVELLNTFNSFVSDIVSQCRTLVFKNANLRTQRDLLLPKLVSGEIDVSDITMPEDKEVEAA